MSVNVLLMNISMGALFIWPCAFEHIDQIPVSIQKTDFQALESITIQTSKRVTSEFLAIISGNF